nr:hypothetical protein [Tanacetum cinerariifolium]
PRVSRAALARPIPEPTHEEFMANVYHDVHESLKFPADEHVILEEPLSLSGTLYLMKHLDDAYTIGDRFLNEKSTEDEPGKLNVDSEVVSMVTVPIHQASSSVLPLSNRSLISLLLNQYPLQLKHQSLQQQKRLQQQPIHFHLFHNNKAHQILKAVHVALQAPIRDRFKELPEADMKEILHQRMFETGAYKSLPEHVALYKDLEASMERTNREEFLAEKDKSRKRRHNTNISDSKDTNFAYLPKIKPRPEWLKPISKEDRPETLEPDFVPFTDLPKPENNWIGKKKLTKSVLEGDKGRRLDLSISKMKAAHYLDFRLKELVSFLWNESERVYDTSTAYGISHRWFKRKEFYITRHDAPSDRSKFRSHMRIPSVISLKTYERYGYTFLKEIVLRRADYKEYKILEADFKNLHPNDFKDLYLLHLQDRFDQKKMMRETKVHKFSDGTMNRILDKLDHMVKDFKLYEYNPGMEIRIWSQDDKRRNTNIMEVIERRLKIQRIFRSLESFVGGRLRDVNCRFIQRTK